VATFAEQVPELTAWYQRRTAGLRDLLEKVALALGGRAGSPASRALGEIVSRFTLIRLVRALPDPQAGPVTVAVPHCRRRTTQPQLAAPAAPPTPKPRQITQWIMTRPDHLASSDAPHLVWLLDTSPGLAAAAVHVRSFAAVMTNRQGQHLDEWITTAPSTRCPPCTPPPTA
jgi:hypothetical protein